MNQAIQDFTQCKRLAVVGVSRTDTKFGNNAYRELKQRGYDVIPIHPEMETFDGDPCYADFEALSTPVEGALISLSPAQVPDVLRKAAQADIRNVWLQQGAESPEAIQLGQELGLNLVHGGCILMYAGPVKGFHAFHGLVWKLIGKY
jgi:predicted CoA-binding protein